MSATLPGNSTVVRTERGLTIAGTRITLYDVMDYVTAGWPPKLIRDRLELTERQITEVMAYIKAHRSEVYAEYQIVLREEEENRRYWEERNRERFARIVAQPPKPEQLAIREKLAEWEMHVGCAEVSKGNADD